MPTLTPASRRRSRQRRKGTFDKATFKYKIVLPLIRSDNLDLDIYYGKRNGDPAIGLKGRF